MSPAKHKLPRLQDSAIFKVVDQAMDEMVHADAVAFELGTEMLNFKDYLYKLLVTRYGLSTLANGYL